jgi:ArsR family transcriptional regulator
MLTLVSQLNTKLETQQEVSLASSAAILKSAGDSLRAQILRILQHDAYGVLELCRIFDTRQPAMSHHLKLLSKAGLVASRREGTNIFYRRSCYQQDDLDTIRHQIFAQLDLCAVDDRIIKRIDEVNAGRAERSRAFFRNNVERFREQQDLIASYSQYGDSVIELIDGLQLPKTKTVLEIGPGEGELLPSLAARFQQVIAVDNSAELLDQARISVNPSATRLPGDSAITNIDFLLGDVNALDPVVNADLVILNMVLHHLAQPADTLKSIYSQVNAGGAVIITDLCQHDQDWARATCGDQWLGFSPEELTGWANKAGFEEGESLFLSQLNGFCVQLRQFLKPAS